MRLSDAGELHLLDRIRKRLGARRRAVLTGIGDDAAVLAADRRKLLATTDMMLEGVHFDLGLVTPRQLGFKLISVNVSDIYAMRGRPAFALLGIAVPGDTGEEFIDGLLDGVDEACQAFGVTVVGGDVSSSLSGMALSATLLGHAEKPLLRSGARPGDGIYVTGTLGDSACGLEVLRRIAHPVDFGTPVHLAMEWGLIEPLLRRHLMPRPRRPGAWAEDASALIDVSDGLLIDLTRLCSESGVGARIYAERVPLSRELIPVAMSLGREPQEFALSGGEDYELLFTSRRRGNIRGATRIGEVVASGMTMVRSDGTEREFGPEGYQHFK
jgi:thiamine-monophosphate kinase